MVDSVPVIFYAERVREINEAFYHFVEAIRDALVPIADALTTACGYRTAAVHRPSKPNIAGSNPAARSNSARAFSADNDGARDALREGCR